MATDTLLVSSHVILQLLDAGYVVGTMFRSLAKADVVRETLRYAGAVPAHLTFFAAALQRDGMPGCPRIYFGVVDVRDVADLHVRAMTHLEAGRSHIANARPAARQHTPRHGGENGSDARMETAETGDAIVATAESLIRFGWV